MELTCVWGEMKEYADSEVSVRRQERTWRAARDFGILLVYDP
jgi:hypothetical protein